MPAYNFSKLRVMVADDSKTMREIMASILAHFYIKHVCLVSSGQEVTTKFNAFEPDLLVLDWEMAPVDGLTLTKIIRDPQGVFNPMIPIVMMTTHTQTDWFKIARDGGVSEIMTKPITAGALYARLVSLVEYPQRFVKAQEYFGPDRRRKSLSSNEKINFNPLND